MALNKNQILTTVSIVYLIALTAIAGYAHSLSQRYSLPLSTALTALTIALPAVSGILIERQQASLRRPKQPLLKGSSSSTSNRTSPTNPATHLSPLTTLTILSLTTLSTTLATLAGTHLAPAASLTCALHDQWQALFRAKDASAIRAIQDGLNCCGLRSVYDMAWPFPEQGRSTCASRFERSVACEGRWRGEEQLVAGLVLGVVVGCWVWDICIVYAPSRRNQSLLRSVFGGAASRDGSADAEDGNAARRAIGYHGAQERYLDDPLSAVEDGEDDAVEHVDRVQNGTSNQVDGQQNGEGSIHHTLIPSTLSSNEQDSWSRR